MRAYRNVNLTLPGNLVSMPVSVAKAVAPNGGDPRLAVVGPDGQKLRSVYLDEDGNEVDRGETLRQAPNGTLLTQEQLSEVNAQTKLDDLSVQAVVPFAKVDMRRVSSAYFVFPNKKMGNKAQFATFVKALKQSKRAAVVKWTPSSRQQLLVLFPEGDTLLALAVGFSEDERTPDEDVTDWTDEKVNKADVDMAAQLLDAVADDEASVLDAEQDEALALKAELLNDPSKVQPKPEAKPATSGVDMAAQLKASLDAVKAAS